MAEKTEKKAHVLSQERIRIKLRSYDHRMLDASVSRIVETGAENRRHRGGSCSSPGSD